MNLEEFISVLKSIQSESELLDFCRKNVIHGTPSIFKSNEDAYYEFRKRISNKFEIDFHEVYISGSAKLGYSPHKNKLFDYESDIDVAIISGKLYDEIMSYVQWYQMRLRDARKVVNYRELNMYHEFLEYTAIGWIRPDKLPYSFQVEKLKKDWFNFFDSLSYGRSEVGNYKVSAGVFKSYGFFESYTISSLTKVKKAIDIGGNNANTD